MSTEEEKKARKKEMDKAYYRANKEKILAYAKEYATANKEKIKQQDRIRSKIYRENNKEKDQLRQKKWNIENREKHTARCTRWAEKNAEKRKLIQRATAAKMKKIYPHRNAARRAVEYAIKSKRLIPEPCKLCQHPKTEAHHSSYAEDSQLKIEWLCKTHHSAWHRVLLAEESSNA